MIWLARRLFLLLTRRQSHTPFRRVASMKHQVQFQYCKVEAPADVSALALVRFTSYDNHDKALAVEQVTYQDDRTGHQDFECQVAAALDCGIDVAVMTAYDLDYFPLIESLVGS